MSLVQLNSYHKVANSSTSRLVSISLPFESVPLSLSSTQFEPTLYFFLVFEMKPQVYLDLITLIAKYKSDNLQYDMLGRWVDGTIVSSTKRLMFQVFFFFIKSGKIHCKNLFISSFYKITKMRIKSLECPKSIRNYEKKYLEHQTLGWVICPIDPATQRINVCYT